MSPGKSVSAVRADLLADLRRALLAADHAALGASCAELGVPIERSERFRTQAALIVQRARAQVPAASSTEVELALGVLWALCVPTPAPAAVSG